MLGWGNKAWADIFSIPMSVQIPILSFLTMSIRKMRTIG